MPASTVENRPPSLDADSTPTPARAGGRLSLAEVWGTIADGVLVLAPDWRIAFVNAPAAKALDHEADALIGRDHWELFPHTHGTELERAYRRSMSGGTAEELDFHSTRTGRWYHVRTYPSHLGLTVTFSDITRRKTADAVRDLTEERFRVAAATPWLTLYEQDVDLRYTWLFPPHPEHRHALGRSDDELGTNGSLAQLAAKKREVMATGVPGRLEVWVKSPTTERWYDTYVAPRRDASGRVIGVTGAALNITDRIRAESALRESETRLRATYVGAPVGIAEADTQGRLISINAKYAAQLGYVPEEMIGASFSDYLHPDDRDESVRDYEQLLAGTGGVETRERRYLHKRGHVVWLAVTRSLVRSSVGKPRFAMAIALDITERKQAAVNQQLLYRLVASVNRAATTAEIYEAALDALCQSQSCARGSILLCDGAGVMRFVASRGLSEAYCAAVEGHSPWRPDDPDPQPVCIGDVAQCALDDRLREVVGRERIAALAFIPLTFERRLLGKFMVYFDQPHEISREHLQLAETIARQVSFAIERRRAAEQLETLVRERTASLREAIQQMEEFSYTVSHDLRAPIRGMMTFANVILEDHASSLSPEILDYLRRIVKNATRMDALVRDTLAYSRVARGELELTAVSLDDCAAQAISEAAPAGVVSVEAPLGRAIASEPLLMQVFTNLLGNAVKFVRRDVAPRIVLSAERRGERVRVSIRDNGIGIPPHQQSRIFAMFERLHASADYEGTGIGLAIVRKAMDRMGGGIGVESDGVNGSTFWIELPAVDGSS